MTEPPAAPQARVDLARDPRQRRARCGPRAGAEVMAVVKADGYGHGLVPVARAARRRRCDLAGHRAARRGAGAARPPASPAAGAVLAARPRRAARPTAIAADVDLSANAPWALDEIAAAARASRAAGPAAPQGRHRPRPRRRGRPPTGRTLVDGGRARPQAEGAVEVVGVWSHLALRRRARPPDDRPPGARRSARRWRTPRRAGLRPGGPPPRQLGGHAHRARRALRPGAARASPSTGCPRCPRSAARPALGLRPAMTLAAGVALVKRVPAGQRRVLRAHVHDRDGDDARAGAARATPTGSRAPASNVGPVLAAGRRRTVAGRVCMDQFVRRPRRRRRGGRATRSCCSARATTASPTAQDWADGAGHDLLRDRHPGRPAGAPGLRRLAVDRPAGARVISVPSLSRRGAVRRRRRRGRRGGCSRRAGGRAVRRRALVPRRRTTRRPTSRSAGCADRVRPGHRRRRRAAARRGRRAAAVVDRGAAGHRRVLPRLRAEPGQLALPAPGPR